MEGAGVRARSVMSSSSICLLANWKQQLWRRDGAIVPMQRIDADHPLAAVEQLGNASAGRLELEGLDTILHRDGRIAHDVEALIDLPDLVCARIGGGKEFSLGAELAGDAALIGQMQCEVLAVGAREIPSVLVLDRATGGRMGGTLHAVSRGGS